MSFDTFDISIISSHFETKNNFTKCNRGEAVCRAQVDTHYLLSNTIRSQGRETEWITSCGWIALLSKSEWSHESLETRFKSIGILVSFFHLLFNDILMKNTDIYL